MTEGVVNLSSSFATGLNGQAASARRILALAFLGVRRLGVVMATAGCLSRGGARLLETKVRNLA